MKRPVSFSRPSAVIPMAVLCTLLWGSAFPSIKLGYQIFQIDGAGSQILFAGLRFTIAGLMVLLVESIRLKKAAVPPKGSLRDITLLGLLQTTVQYCFFYVGLAHTTGMKGSILNATGSFIAVVLAHFAYRDDRLNARKIVGCAVGFCGVILVNLGSGSAGGGFSFLGEGFLILANAAFAAGFLLSKRATEKASPGTVTGWQLFLGGVVLVLLGLAGGGSIPVVTINGLLLLLYLAFLSAAAFTVWAILLQHNPVGKIAVFHFLTPIFGVLLSAVFLGEHFSGLKDFCALLLVCLGIAVVNRPKRKNKISL